MHQTPPDPADTLARIDRERVARLERAGVRRIPTDAAPTSAFVAVETAVLVMVAALAMTSIIVTAGDPDDHALSVARSTHPVVVAAQTDLSHRDALPISR